MPADFWFFNGGYCDVTWKKDGVGTTEYALKCQDLIAVRYVEDKVERKVADYGTSPADVMITGAHSYIEMTIVAAYDGVNDESRECFAELFGRATADVTASKTGLVVEDPSGALGTQRFGVVTLKPWENGVGTTQTNRHIIMPKAVPSIDGANIDFDSTNFNRGVKVRFDALVHEEVVDTVNRKVLWKTGVNPVA
jgi:hypothetical protein